MPDITSQDLMKPGDLILVHADHFVSKLIRFGQRLRFRGDRRKFAYWNHAALVLDEKGSIAEALSHGVVKTHISKYDPSQYVWVPITASDEGRAQILFFANDVLAARWKYGYIEIVNLAFSLLTGSKIVIGKIGTAICSGFYASAATRAGYVFDRPPDYNMPADLAEHFGVAAGSH